MALALTWGGAVDTGIPFAEFFDENFTIAVRFLRQYPSGYAGPFFCAREANGSDFFFAGQGDFGDSGLPPTQVPDPLPPPNGMANLQIGIGDVVRTLWLPADHDWHHLALVCRSGQTRIYVDGDAKGAPIPWPSTRPLGTLVLGRMEGLPPRGRGNQFLGLLDDLAIFRTALLDHRVKSLADARHLSGQELGLLAGYIFGFTPESGTVPDTLKRPLASKTPAARIVPVSDTRMGMLDLQQVPLPLNAHMRLPFPRGEEWRVSQGTHNPSGSHQGYAVFAWDFVRSGSGSEGKPFLSCAPGQVTALNETQPSGTSAVNFVTVQQAPEEFCDYIHLKKDSVPVKPGDDVGFGTLLGAVSNTGADSGAHLHLAVTTNGEEHARGSDFEPFFFTIPVAFSNYDVKHGGSGDWKRVIRGIPRDEDMVRNPAEDGPILYNAVWEKDSAAEVHVYDWKLAQVKEKDHALRGEGWRIHRIRSAAVGGVPRYAVVWRKRAGDEEPAFELGKDAFEEKHASFVRRGWMLHTMAVSLKNGAVRYTGVWKPGTVQQELRLAQSRPQCEADANQRNGEWRMQTIAAFPAVSVDLYATVWTRHPRHPGGGSYQFVHGVKYQEFRSKYDALWKEAWRLSHLSVCNPQAQVPLFTAYWEKKGGPEIQVYRWNYEDVRAKYDVLWELGWRLKIIEPYTR